MAGQTLEAQIKGGTAKIQGDPSLLAKLAATMVDFDPRFKIMHGTQAAGVSVAKANPYEAAPRQPVAE